VKELEATTEESLGVGITDDVEGERSRGVHECGFEEDCALPCGVVSVHD
jgi:hypothetical protein